MTDIGPPIFDLLNIRRYANFHRYFYDILVMLVYTAQFTPNSS